MQYFTALLPFLVVPLLLPPTSGGLQMIGLVSLLLAGFVHLIPSKSKQDLVLSNITLLSIAFITVMTISLWFLFPSIWMFQSLFPSILAGWIAFILIVYMQPHPLHAIGMMAVASWAVLLYQDANHLAVPAEFIYPHWNALFADFVNPPVSPIVSHPESHFLLHWQWLAYTSSFIFLLTIFFQPAIRCHFLYSFLLGIVLICYCSFFVYVVGNAAFWVMAVSLAAFIVFYLIPSQLLTVKHGWQWGCFLLCLTAGGLGWLDFLLLLFSQLLMNIEIPLLVPVTIPETPVALSMASIPFLEQWQPADWVSLVVMIGFFTAAIPVYSIKFTNPSNTAAYVALALSTLFLLPVSPLQWISHPVLWVCLAGFIFTQDSQNEEHEDEDEFGHDFIDTHHYTVVDYRSIAATGAMGLLAIIVLNTERAANQNLLQLMQHTLDENRIDMAEQTHLQSYYRPDIRSVYLSWEIHNAVEQSVSPPEGRLIELEIASQICSQSGFIPYFAIKRISDFYTLQGNSSRAVSSLNDVLVMHPQDYKLHEMMAGRLFEFGQYEEALTHYRICVNHSPTAVRYHEKIALAYKSLGADEEYESAMQIINTLNPANTIQ